MELALEQVKPHRRQNLGRKVAAASAHRWKEEVVCPQFESAQQRDPEHREGVLKFLRSGLTIFWNGWKANQNRINADLLVDKREAPVPSSTEER